MSTSRDLIRKIDIFEPLDDKIINKIAQVCIPREYSAGDYIVRQGDPGLGLYFITRGRVKVEIDTNSVKTLVAHLEAGSFLGELSIIDNKPRSANVICLADTGCLLLTRDSFQKLMNKYPEIAIQMARALAARLRKTDERMGQYAITAPAPPASAGDAASASTPRTDSQAATERTRIKGLLADSFGFLYLLKSLAQVSLAVVGCPVTVHRETPASEMLQTTIGDVKLVLLPACEPQVLRLDAFDDGDFSATLFRPVVSRDSVEIFVSRFAGHVHRNESKWLYMPTSQGTWMEHSTNSAHAKSARSKPNRIARLSRPRENDSNMQSVDRLLASIFS